MTALDDLTLIQHFVTAQLTLAANRHLRLETVGDTVQLSSCQHGLAASRKQATAHSPIQVRRSTPYWSLLVHILAEHGFMQMEERTGLVLFEHQPLPLGYAMNCTPASTLWKFWRSRQSNPQRLRQPPLQLLVSVQAAWTPVQALACSGGCIYITTLTDEIMLQTDDRLVWLHQLEAPSAVAESTVCLATASTVTSVLPVSSTEPTSVKVSDNHPVEQAVSDLVLRQLRRQLGLVPEPWQAHVQALSLLQLGVLGEDLLSFRTLIDLSDWLQTRGGQSAPLPGTTALTVNVCR